MDEIAPNPAGAPVLSLEELQKERVHPLMQWLNNEYDPHNRSVPFDYAIDRQDTHAGLILLLADLCVEKGLVAAPDRDHIRNILENGPTVFDTQADGNRYGLISEDLLRILFSSLLVPHMRERVRRMARAARLHEVECAPHDWEFEVEEAAAPWGYRSRRSYLVTLPAADDTRGDLEGYGRVIGIPEALSLHLGDQFTPDMANRLAMAYMRRGKALRDAGDTQGAIEGYGRAIAIYEDLRERLGEQFTPDMANSLVWAYMFRGDVLRVTGDTQGTIEDHGRAIAIREDLRCRLGEQFTPDMADDLAWAYRFRGDVLRVTGDTQGTIEDHGRAIAIYEDLRCRLGEQFTPDMADDLAWAYRFRGDTLRATGDRQGAIEDYGRASAIREALRPRQGEQFSPDMADDLASTCPNSGDARRDTPAPPRVEEIVTRMPALPFGGAHALAQWYSLAKDVERKDADFWAYARNQPDLQVALVVLLAEIAMERDLVAPQVKEGIREMLYQPRTFCSMPWVPTEEDQEGCRLRKLPDTLLDLLSRELLNPRLRDLGLLGNPDSAGDGS